MRVTSPRQSRGTKPNFLAPNRFNHLRVDSSVDSVSRSRSISAKRKLIDDYDSDNAAKRPANAHRSPSRGGGGNGIDYSKIESIETNLAKVASLCDSIPEALSGALTGNIESLVNVITDMAQALKIVGENQTDILSIIKEAPPPFAQGIPHLGAALLAPRFNANTWGHT